MLTIFIDGKPFEVDEDENLLSACLSLGFDIPYFCWHPALHSVGSCRVCAVKQYRDESDDRGRIIMSCTTPVQDGMRISIDDPEVRRFRASVIELLMINHPHDCPVCDEGGECHLQDMTLLTGHNYRRYRFTKRTHRSQDLGPFIHHEMNRCIQCYRCVRFYRDYAGGRDLDVLGTHDHVYFGRYEDGMLENGFAGNLAEVCPTGVFTDATLRRHYTRKWDLQSSPSICIHCGLGCNIIAGERYGLLRCIRNRYNSEVNGYFLCDRGRFGYGFTGSPSRLHTIYERNGAADPLRPVPAGEAAKRLEEILRFGSRVIGIGSPRASLEANQALRLLVGPENFYAGFSPTESRLIGVMIDILDKCHVNPATIMETQWCDAVFVLGEDVTSTAPRLALALRQTVQLGPYREAERAGIPFWEDKAKKAFIQYEKGPFFIASVCPTGLDDIATRTRCGPPDDLARLGYAVAHHIDPSAPEVDGLGEDDAALASRIARALMDAEKPLVVSGTGALSEPVLRAAQSVAVALKKSGRPSSLFLAAPECNSLGLGLMGGPGIEEALEAAGDEETEAVIVLENDLSRRMDRERFQSFSSSVRHLVVIDHVATETASRASLLLPAAPFAQSDGTYVNTEGRAQKSFRAFPAGGQVKESWRWIGEMMSVTGHHHAGHARNPDELLLSLSRDIPAFARLPEAAPDASFRVSGLKIPRQPVRYSGRTAMHADVSVHEPQTHPDPDSPLAFSMEGYEGVPPASLVPRYAAPGWNSPQAVDKYQSRIGGPPTGGDPGVRLLEQAHGGPITYHGTVPEAFQALDNHFLLAPVYHLFGSEELSALSPEIGGISPEPYLGLSPDDAKSLGIEKDGETVELDLGGASIALPARFMAGLPVGIAGYPAGLPGTEWLELPCLATIRKGQV